MRTSSELAYVTCETELPGARVAFRTNAYSGTTRGVVLNVDAPADAALGFAIRDLYLNRVVLDDAFPIPLADRRAVITRLLDAPERACRPCFTREPSTPTFTLQADWIDTAWPKVVSLDWEDAGSAPAYYYVRVEQIDGNIAWSSPIWFVDEPPM